MNNSQIFTTIRKIIFPYDKLEKFVDKKGKLLEIGCGHGHISALLAINSSVRRVLGIDPAKNKIAKAKSLAADLRNLKFKAIYLQDLKPDKFDTVLISDVLYLLPENKKIELLKLTKKYLSREGKLILKEVEKNNSLFYYWILFEEFLAAKVFKFTKSDYQKTYLLTKQEYRNLLTRCGFKIIRTENIRGVLPYPHVVFVAK